MTPHGFSHAGVAYEVRFRRMDNQWFATLYVEGEEHGMPLLPSPNDISIQLSDEAVRVGFIAVAEWLVKTGPSGLARSTDERHENWSHAA